MANYQRSHFYISKTFWGIHLQVQKKNKDMNRRKRNLCQNGGDSPGYII